MRQATYDDPYPVEAYTVTFHALVILSTQFASDRIFPTSARLLATSCCTGPGHRKPRPRDLREQPCRSRLSCVPYASSSGHPVSLTLTDEKAGVSACLQRPQTGPAVLGCLDAKPTAALAVCHAVIRAAGCLQVASNGPCGRSCLRCCLKGLFMYFSCNMNRPHCW